MWSVSRVEVTPDGAVVALDSGNCRIQRFTATGSFLGKWDLPIDPERCWAVDVATSADGIVRVGTMDGRVLSYTSSGTEVGDWQARSVIRVDRMAVTRNGDVLLLDVVDHEWGRARVRVYSDSGEALGSWPVPTYEPFARLDMAVSADNLVLISNESERIWRFTPSGQRQADWPAHPGVERVEAWMISAAPDGGMATLNWDPSAGTAETVRLANDGTPLGVVSLSVKWKLGNWIGLDVMPDGLTYVVTAGDVDQYDRLGTYLGKLVKDRPTTYVDVAVGASLIFAADASAGAVDVFDKRGTLIRSWPMPGQAERPWGIAVGDDSTVYVGLMGSCQVHRLHQSGEFIGTVDCSLHTDPQGCRLDDRAGPAKPDINGTGLFVVAGNTRCVQRFTPDGEVVGVWPIDDLELMPTLEGFALAPDGRAFVTSRLAISPVRELSQEGKLESMWSRRGFGEGELLVPGAVGVDRTGRVVLVDIQGHGIQVLAKEFPHHWRVEFFANRWLAEPPPLILESAEAVFDWGTASPRVDLPVDNFSAIITRGYTLDAPGTYSLRLTAQGGARLWLNERILVDNWDGPTISYSAAHQLEAGDHWIRLEYNDPGGPASVHLTFEPANLTARAYLPLASN
jgi:hypothetical protein